jgi:anti-sigma B factor antagonist
MQPVKRVDQPVKRADQLGLHEEERDGRHTLTLVGELDLSTSGELEAAITRLCADGAREIVLDLHGISFVDSTGLRVILTGGLLCEGHACDFSLTRVQVPVQRLFEQTGLGERLSFHRKALTRRVSRQRPSATVGPLDLSHPQFETSFELRPDATRSARNYVGDLVPDVSQNVREAMMLLTSELVTRAVRQRPPAFDEPAELRVWLRPDRVRVELRARTELLFVPPEPTGPHYDHILLDQIADRWSIDTGEDFGCTWFEIDLPTAVTDAGAQTKG